MTNQVVTLGNDLMRSSLFLLPALALLGCGNPGGVSDEFYAKYKELAPPKILYRCDNDIGYTAAKSGFVNYNGLLADAKSGCDEFKILEEER